MPANSVFDKVDMVEAQLINGEYHGDLSGIKEEINTMDDNIAALAQGLQFIAFRVGGSEKEIIEKIAEELEAIRERLY